MQSSFAADSVEEIRGIRTEMNVGFNGQPRNFDFISTRLTANFTLIGPAGRYANPDELAKFYTNLTKRRPDVTWTRTLELIEVNEEWNSASERGTWKEVWMEPDGETILTGTYQALWKRVQGKWFLDAEIFIPSNAVAATIANPNRSACAAPDLSIAGAPTKLGSFASLSAPRVKYYA